MRTKAIPSSELELLRTAFTWNETVTKPVEYPQRILKALFEHYAETGDLNMEEKEVRERANIPEGSLYNALRVAMGQGWLEEGTEGRPYFSYIDADGSHSIITLSARGVEVGQQLVRSWYQKVGDFFKKYCVRVVVEIARVFFPL